MAAYTTSKAGVHAFTHALRADLAETAIRVIEILPGLTRTDLIRKRYRGDRRRAEEYYERFKMALDPQDVAGAILFALNAPRHAVLAQITILPNNRW
jgi:3-hydroxy acid dehydrogenase / malonic semialdehyde reductase